MKSSPSAPAEVPLAWRVWLGIGVWAGLGTHLLSAWQQSHVLGWGLWAVVGISGGIWAWGSEFGRLLGRCHHQVFRHFRRGPPRWFLALAFVGALGGVLYDPTNWDTQWYRIPRVLHWLAEERWHFVPSVEGRINFIAPGLEWLWTPIVAWTRSDRWLFLPNLYSFLLLPGAAWRLYRAVGVPMRTAWWAMWLLPTAWIFCFQCGSAANDAISAPYLMIAVALAIEGARQGRLRPLLWSAFAAALLSNVKQSNLPLGLLWFIPAVVAWRIWWNRPFVTAATLLAATAVSFVPVTLMNLRHTGHWMGWSREEQTWVPRDHGLALVANVVFATHQSIAPPVLPWANTWNKSMRELAVGPLSSRVKGFEDFGKMPNAVSETWAGVGLPFALLWFAGWMMARRPARRCSGELPRWIVATRRCIWPLLLLFLSQTGTYQIARYLSAYYPFLLVPFLLATQWRQVLQTRWWHWGAWSLSASSLILMLLSRQRPVLPTPGMTQWLAEHGAGERWQDLALRQQMQQHLHRRFDAFLPTLSEEKLIGLAALSTGETSLWKPYQWGPGQRRVHYLRHQEDVRKYRDAGMRYAIQNDLSAMASGYLDGLDWAERMGGQVGQYLGASREEVLARRQSPVRPTLDDLARSRLGPDGKLLVDVIYLVTWEQP